MIVESLRWQDPAGVVHDVTLYLRDRAVTRCDVTVRAGDAPTDDHLTCLSCLGRSSNVGWYSYENVSEAIVNTAGLQKLDFGDR